MSFSTRSDRWFIGGVVLLALVAIFVLVVPSGDAAPTAPPANTAEPNISGRAEQGRELSASRGSWTGGGLSFAYRWVRCGANGGRPDGSDCTSIAGATGTRHTVTAADVGFRLRVRVTATNSEGSQTVASNPTAVVVGAARQHVAARRLGKPARRLDASPCPTGTGAAASRSPSRTRGCAATPPGGSARRYRVRPAAAIGSPSSDVNRKLRIERHSTERGRLDDRPLVRVRGRRRPAPARSDQAAERRGLDPTFERADDQRLIVSQVVFSPNPVASRRGR